MAIITISRGTLSGGTELAQTLARQLNYICVSRENIVERAKTYGLEERELFESVQADPLARGARDIRRRRYLTGLRAAMFHYVRRDNVVYHGHAGHMLLARVPTLLRVRCVAPVSRRAAEVAEHTGRSESEAVKYVHQKDAQRLKWSRYLFNMDWQDPANYDAVFNNDRFGMSDICELVCRMVECEAFRSTPERQREIEDLALASEVEAEILGGCDSGATDVDARAESGVITLTGRVRSELTAERVETLARGVAGVRDVRNHLRSMQSESTLTAGA